MTRKLGIVGIVGLCLSLIGLVVWAATINVPGDYKTIQDAINHAQPGDTILLAPGVYTENVTLDGKDNITIKASDPDPSKTILQGEFDIKNTKGTTLQGFTITGGVFGLLAQSTTGLHLDGMHINGNSNTGVQFSGSCNDVLIENSQINGNGMDGINLECTGSNVTIKNNTINDNGQTNARGVGIRLSSTVTNVAIEDNVCENNAFACIHPQ